MKLTTLVFLTKKEKGNIKNICLAMKKRGFGSGKYNGSGGKVKINEDIETGAKREVFEEIGIRVKSLYKVAECRFLFSKKSELNQFCHVFFSEEWEDDLIESEEMAPEWFDVKDIPFDKMWPDDILWLPKVLEGKFLKADFIFGDDDIIESQNIVEIVNF